MMMMMMVGLFKKMSQTWPRAKGQFCAGTPGKAKPPHRVTGPLPPRQVKFTTPRQRGHQAVRQVSLKQQLGQLIPILTLLLLREANNSPELTHKMRLTHCS